MYVEVCMHVLGQWRGANFLAVWLECKHSL